MSTISCIPCRSLIDYIMPVKEMVRKMTGRRKYVIISNNPDPEYLDDIEETFVRVELEIIVHCTYNVHTMYNVHRIQLRLVES